MFYFLICGTAKQEIFLEFETFQLNFELFLIPTSMFLIFHRNLKSISNPKIKILLAIEILSCPVSRRYPQLWFDMAQAGPAFSAKVQVHSTIFI